MNVDLLSKLDERALALAMFREPWCSGRSALMITESLGIPYKRARYILSKKWWRRDWVCWGVSWRCSWLEPEGREALAGIFGFPMGERWGRDIEGPHMEVLHGGQVADREREKLKNQGEGQ